MTKDTTVPDKSKLTSSKLKRAYKKLSAPFPEEAIQEGNMPGVGKVKGVKVQYIYDRLNEVLGSDHWREIIVENPFTDPDKNIEVAGKTVRARAFIKLELGNWEEGRFIPIASKSHGGGSTNMVPYQACKGALTNALKKVASLYGIGGDVFRGELDEDFVRSDGPELQELEQQVAETKLQENESYVSQGNIADATKSITGNKALDSFYEMADKTRIKKETELALPEKFLEGIKNKVTAKEYRDAKEHLDKIKKRFKK